MQTINGTGGLCMTCNNAPSCYHHARRGPALFCELFDGYAPPAEQITSARAMPAADLPAPRRAAEKEAPKYTGLCVNCDHRQTCTHPRPEGGVWHCEDYE